MTTSILERFRQSGDANIGQTLLRLAALAEAAHGYESAYGNVSDEKVSPRKVSPAHGSGRSAVVGDRDIASVHMEVER